MVALISDTCVFKSIDFDLSKTEKPSLLLAIYVDDGLIMSNREDSLQSCIQHLRERFEITVRKPRTSVGLQIEELSDGLKIHQKFYIEQVLQRFNMTQVKPVVTQLKTNVKFSKSGTEGFQSKAVNVPYREAIGYIYRFTFTVVSMNTK